MVRGLDAGGACRRARQHGRALLLLLRLREQECEMRCAARAADVGGRVGAAAGRGCHAAGAWRGERRGAWEKGPAHGGRPGLHGTGLGRAEARRAALQEARWVGFGRRARSEAAAREGEKVIFQIYFQGISKCPLSNIILSKKMTSFENVPKMKVV